MHAPLMCACVSRLQAAIGSVDRAPLHICDRHNIPTWAELLKWTGSATLAYGSPPFELKHITLLMDVLQAKASLKQPDNKTVFNIRTLTRTKCRAHVLTALLAAYRPVLVEQLRELKAKGYTEARAISIGEGLALHKLVEECCQAVGLPLLSLENGPHLSCALNGRLNGARPMHASRFSPLQVVWNARSAYSCALTLPGAHGGS